MPGNQSSTKPESASVSSASDEESHLELYLQKQLEEDIARIFDESIYSDLEVVCGKLKILTHSCILKARTHTFYKKLETILHVKIDRDTFDEIYSFISDAYTECNINHQEKEIITYLNANVVEFAENNKTANDESGETEVFLTPKCVVSPFEEKNVQKSISSSPSTELTKEYYALVPIDNNLLEKELKEQDALSNAFQTIIKSQTEFRTQTNVANLIKPTTLFLNSSHSSKTVKHSSSCDSLRRTDLKDIINIHIKDFVNENSTKAIASHDDKTPKVESITDFNPDTKQYISEINAEKNTESGFSPDSLLTDDPSSVSDYISAAYTFSPGAASSSYLHQLNVGDHNTKMENVLSDSGCENTRIMESLSSHKDVTVTDISLTESTLHDLALDEAGYSQECIQNPLEDKNKSNLQTTMSNSNSLPGILLEKNVMTSKPTCFKEYSSCSASKEEKQRQNEEIVIMESSSVSSETGSWESVFPPKFDDKEICQTFLLHEHQFSKGFTVTNVRETNNSNTRAHNVRPDALESFQVNRPYKSTSCFIDAASLSEDDVPIPNIALDKTTQPNNTHALPVPFIPVACSSVKLDMSPNEWSESNENDDSLEQPENKSQHKDLSPTIFEMTPEDSLSVQNSDEIRVSTIMGKASTENITSTDKFREPSTVAPNPPFTPYNSILSLMDTSLKTYESDGSESNITLIGHTNQVRLDFKENNKSVSSTSSAIFSKDDEEYNSEAYFSSGSYSTNHQLDDMPVVFGRCEIKENKQEKIPKNSCAPVWVVDMKPDSVTTQSDEKNPEQVKNTSKPYYNIDNTSNKSRSSVDSESSDRSSQKFFIDLASLPDPLPTEKQVDKESINEKKNMFSMFIDLGEKSSVKEMPARLSSSLTNKKSNNVSSKNSSNNTKEVKPALNSNEHDEVKCSLITFEKLESLCNDPSFSISEIIGISETITTQDKSDDDIQPKQQNEKTFATHIVTNTIKEEDESRHGHEAEFVKLSDLDKPSLISDISVNEYTTIDVRMTRSIPDRNWGEQSVSSRSIGFFSPYHSENALSLNRLFPHLKNEFSKSMPGSLSLRTKSPMRQGNGEIEDQVSDVSEPSSIQSSFCRSIIGNSTTEDTSQTSSLINNCQSRLGQDLLRMFLEEIAPDVTVEVAGKRIKAHKCILSSRCQYFAGILSGGWVQSAGNVIVLPTFSYNVVHFAMCHIYSGISAIPDSVSILELATLADMLGLEGLKEAIMFTLKAKYCHHFHRPCTLCIAGVLECFPLSSAYGLDDLYRKCLKWITKYFFKVWPTKAFATLPYELLDKCYQQHVVNLSTENLIDTVYGCGIILASLQNIKWSEIVERLCRRLVNAAGHFVAAHLSEMVQVAATRVEEAPSTARQALLDCFAAAIEWAPPDEACRTYAYLSAIIKQKKQNNSKPDLNADVGQGNNMSASLLFAHATLWRLQCESALVRSAPRVVTTQAFQELSPDLRKRLRELGCIMYGAPSAKSMPALGHERKTKINSNKNSRSDITSVNYNLAELVRSTFVPYSSKPLTQSASIDVMKSNNDIRDNKKMNHTHPPQIKTTKAQEERAKFNLAKTKQMEKQNRQPAVVRGASSFKNTKPRYLEPKANKEVNKKTVEKKNGVKVISSSDSSRYSSSAQLGTVRDNRWGAQGSRACVAHAHSPDSLATSSRPRTAEPSTDSLSESQNNKYGTYTKAKHPAKAPVENVKSLKTQSGDQKMLNIKGKSKLPIHLRHSAPQKCFSGKTTTGDSKSKALSVAKERATGSLMNATKSSSAKVAHKLVKEPQAKSHKERKSQTKASTSRAMSAPKDSVIPHEPLMMGGSTYRDAVIAYENSTMNAPREDENTFEIPAMERSGTFLKDEPTFGNKSWWGEWGGPSGL